jgi:hypothetical protein
MLKNYNLRVSCDLDDTIFSFIQHYYNRFGIPKTDLEITKNVRGVLLSDSDFWLSQPIIHALNFTPHCYCTARLITKNLIRKQLQINNLPEAPIYQVKGVALSKLPQIKRSRCDVHVDDSIRVFIDLNTHNVPCLLIDSEANREWGPIGRIYSLDKEEIEDAYNLFLTTIYPNFKDLL